MNYINRELRIEAGRIRWRLAALSLQRTAAFRANTTSEGLQPLPASRSCRASGWRPMDSYRRTGRSRDGWARSCFSRSNGRTIHSSGTCHSPDRGCAQQNSSARSVLATDNAKRCKPRQHRRSNSSCRIQSARSASASGPDALRDWRELRSSIRINKSANINFRAELSCIRWCRMDRCISDCI